jgi:hypothetical protein
MTRSRGARFERRAQPAAHLLVHYARGLLELARGRIGTIAKYWKIMPNTSADGA